MKVGLATASTEQLMFLLLQALDNNKKLTSDYSCLYDREEAENFFGFVKKVMNRKLVSLLKQSF